MPEIGSIPQRRTLRPDPAATAKRKMRRVAKVTRNGERPAACLLCGHDRVEALEDAHVANRLNDPLLTVVLCRNCHRDNTENLAAGGVPTRYDGDEPTPVQRLVTFVMGTAVLMSDVRVRMVDWARWMDELSATGVTPNWTPGVPDGKKVPS